MSQEVDSTHRQIFWISNSPKGFVVYPFIRSRPFRHVQTRLNNDSPTELCGPLQLLEDLAPKGDNIILKVLHNFLGIETLGVTDYLCHVMSISRCRQHGRVNMWAQKNNVYLSIAGNRLPYVRSTISVAVYSILYFYFIYIYTSSIYRIQLKVYHANSSIHWALPWQ